MSSDSFTPQPEVPSESEESPAPHLAAPSAEVWTAVPLDPPARGLTPEEKWPSEWHTVCWMAAHGAAQTVIAKELGYSAAGISLIMNKPQVQEKIEQIRREFLGTESLNKKFASIAPKAADYLTSVILGREATKTAERIDASKWMLEKVSGKAKQEGATDGGTTILQLLQALDTVKEAQAARAVRGVTEAADIELTAEPQQDSLAAWVEQNVPGGTNEES